VIDHQHREIPRFQQRKRTMNRNSQKSRFEIMRLEERLAPAPAATLIPSVLLVDENVRGFHGAQNACPGLDNAADHNSNPVLGIQMIRHDCVCECQPPPPSSSPLPPSPPPA